MSNAMTDRNRTATPAPTSGRRRGFILGQTEARPGFLTSEMWLTVISAAVLVIAGYVSDAFDVDLAWALFAGVIAAYVLSRGLAKAGSREGPFIIGGDSEGSPRSSSRS